MTAYAVGTVLAFAGVGLRRGRLLSLAAAAAAVGLAVDLAWWARRAFLGPPLFADVVLDDALGLVAVAAVAAYLWAQGRWRLQALGVLILPLALLLHLSRVIWPGPAFAMAPALRDRLLAVHIGVSALGVGALVLTAAASILYLVQEHGLKVKRPARLYSVLPSLDACDRALSLSLLVGFALLTAGLVSGALWSTSAHGRPRLWQNPTETPALIAWALLGILLWTRLIRGWRGRRTAVLALAGFAALLVRLLTFSLAGRSA